MAAAIRLEIDTGLKDVTTSKPSKNQPTLSSLALRFQATKKHGISKAKTSEASFNELIQTKLREKAREKQTRLGGLRGFFHNKL